MASLWTQLRSVSSLYRSLEFSRSNTNHRFTSACRVVGRYISVSCCFHTYAENLEPPFFLKSFLITAALQSWLADLQRVFWPDSLRCHWPLVDLCLLQTFFFFIFYFFPLSPSPEISLPFFFQFQFSISRSITLHRVDNLKKTWKKFNWSLREHTHTHTHTQKKNKKTKQNKNNKKKTKKNQSSCPLNKREPFQHKVESIWDSNTLHIPRQ